MSNYKRATYPRKEGYYNNNGQHNYTPFVNQKAHDTFTKKSGAKLTKYTPTKGDNAGHEMLLVTGWRLSNRELISFKCTTTSKSKLSEKGWIGSIACTLTNTKTGVTAFHWGTMEKKTGKVVIDKIAVVLNPKVKNGGFCGSYLGGK